MAQAKKKTATKTAKKNTARQQTCRKNCTKTAKKQQGQADKIHVYIVTAMAIVAGVLLCANAAMMMV
ncbi:hypothetical protein IJG71_03145 [Candidatus Saccharibacteria bacterium]|nr:hypothetical protein [Candidatus Saccharibacteria bacterium]